MLEPPGLSSRDGKRPDGLTLFPWKAGKNLIWDYTCRDTLAASHIAGTSKETGKAAKEAEASKNALYNNQVTEYEFILVAMETFGSCLISQPCLNDIPHNSKSVPFFSMWPSMRTIANTSNTI